MKVLQINSVCGRGSTGRIATDLADVLAEQGHDCRIAYGRGSVPEKYKDIAIRIGSDLDVRLHGIKTRLFDLHGFGSYAATKRFLKWLQEYNPDVIHLHNIHGYYINIELLFDYLKNAGKPVIWTLHDCWAFTGHCAYFTAADCEQWKTNCRNCSQLRKYPGCFGVSYVEENFWRKKRAFVGVPNLTIVTPSKWLAELVNKSFLAEYPVKVIHNGIDLDLFKPTKSNFREKYDLTDKSVVLGVASVWDERKGLDDLVSLSKMLDGRYKIVLVGLTERQKKEMPTEILCFTRTNNEKELVEIYSAADVFVNPTYEDNFPTTNLESLACGTPVITYDTGGSPEAISEDVGITVAVGDVISLCKSLEEIVNNEKQYNAILTWSKNFNKKRVFETYSRLYIADGHDKGDNRQ